MVDFDLLCAILDSLPEPILVADTDHITRYMNAAAKAYYKGGAALIGQSLLDCHNERSQARMKEVLLALQAGADEQLISEKENCRVYMRAVRNAAGQVVGYYERYEPPPK